MICTEYGSPSDVLKMKEVPRPPMGDKEVLVRIIATSENYNNLFLLKVNRTGICISSKN